MSAVKPSHGVLGRQPAVSIDVNTRRACGTTSRKQPGLSLVPPSGPCMKVWKAPPGRRSKARTSVVQGFGHHHSFSKSGSVHARHNAATGARRTRVMTRSLGSALSTGCVDIGLLLLMKLFDEFDHPVGSRF